jgi:predicted LPLAT superfamily acyltransferase
MSRPQTDSSAQQASWHAQGERGNLAALRLITWITLHVGRWASRLLLWPIALYFWCVVPAARRASRQYLALCLGRSVGAWSVIRHIHTFSAVILDRIFFLNGQLDRFDIQTADADGLALRTASSGVGMFLMGAHLGSFESVRSIARDNPALVMHLLMYEDNARNIKQMLAAINPQAQQSIIGLGQPGAMLAVRDKLDAGDLIGILADRSLDAQGLVTVDFLGRAAQFPLGPFRMAMMLKRPVFFMAGIYHGGARYTIHLDLIHDFSQGETGEAQCHHALQQYVARLEQHCRAAPYNWFNFFDFWQAPVSRP